LKAFDANLNLRCGRLPRDSNLAVIGSAHMSGSGESLMSVLGDIIAGALEFGLEFLAYGGFSRRRVPPPLPTQLSDLESMAMISGAAVIVFVGLMGLGMFLHQWQQERFLLTEPATPAIIVSINRESKRNDFTEALLDYERQTPGGPVACRRAQALFRSGNFAVGERVEVHPQPGSCYRPVYAPDVGNPRMSLLVSAIAFPVGIALFGAGFSSFRQRQRQLARMASARSSAAAASF